MDNNPQAMLHRQLPLPSISESIHESPAGQAEQKIFHIDARLKSQLERIQKLEDFHKYQLNIEFLPRAELHLVLMRLHTRIEQLEELTQSLDHRIYLLRNGHGREANNTLRGQRRSRREQGRLSRP